MSSCWLMSAKTMQVRPHESHMISTRRLIDDKTSDKRHIPVTTIWAVPDTIAVDSVIHNYLRQPYGQPADALAASGESGLLRLLDVWYGHATEPFVNPISDIPDIAVIDRWASAIAITAVAAPSAFIDAIADLHMSTMLLAILGDISDSRATQILRQHLDDDDWLSRCSAVASLGRRTDEAARPGIEKALADPNLVVRSAAIDAVSHWDPDRAIALYTELLDAEGLTPELRSQVRATITLLRAGPPKPE
jgi:HEAT repeat protein